MSYSFSVSSLCVCGLTHDCMTVTQETNLKLQYTLRTLYTSDSARRAVRMYCLIDTAETWD